MFKLCDFNTRVKWTVMLGNGISSYGVHEEQKKNPSHFSSLKITIWQVNSGKHELWGHYVVDNVTSFTHFYKLHEGKITPNNCKNTENMSSSITLNT